LLPFGSRIDLGTFDSIESKVSSLNSSSATCLVAAATPLLVAHAEFRLQFTPQSAAFGFAQFVKQPLNLL
jgi:hypothetical protein